MNLPNKLTIKNIANTIHDFLILSSILLLSFEFFVVTTKAAVRLSCPPPPFIPKLFTYAASFSVTAV